MRSSTGNRPRLTPPHERPAHVFDTGPIVAALDPSDRYHHACTDLIANTPGVLLLPVPVIVEAAQLAHARLGVAAEAAFTESVAREQQFTIISPTEHELPARRC